MPRLRLAAAVILLVPLAAAVFAASSRTDEGVRLFDARRLSESRATLEAAARDDPRDARAAYYLGRALVAQDELDKAVESLERAASLDPTSSEIYQWLGRALGFLAARVNVFRQASLAPRVRRAFERAVELGPDNVEARLDLLEYYVQAPGIMGGSLEKARVQAAEIARRDRMRGYRAAGRIADHDKRFDAALAEYARAESEFPERLEPALWAANVHVARKNYGKAFDALESFLARNPTNMPACFHVGRVAAISGDRLERGEECLTRYLAYEPKKDEPQQPLALARLGQISEKKGDRPAARRAYESALKLDASLKDAREGLKRLRAD
jgi:tetratricopeptide (TPR) repeat protein